MKTIYNLKRYVAVPFIASLLGVGACDILDETIEFEDDLIQVSSDSEWVIPLLKTEQGVTIADIIGDISPNEDLQLKVDGSGNYYFAQNDTMEIASLNEVAKGMGMDTDRGSLFSIPDFETSSEFQQDLNNAIALFKIENDLPKITFILSPMHKETFLDTGDLSFSEIKVYLPFSFPESSAIVDFGVSYLAFNAGQLTLSLGAGSNVTTKLVNVGNSHDEEILGVKSGDNYTFDLSGKVFDLWESKVDGDIFEVDGDGRPVNALAVDALPRLEIVPNGGTFSFSGITLGSNVTDEVKFVFRESTMSVENRLDPILLDEGVSNFDLDNNDFFNQSNASISFNPNNPDLRVGINMVNPFGVSLLVNPNFEVGFKDQSGNVNSNPLDLTDGTNSLGRTLSISPAISADVPKKTPMFIDDVADVLVFSPSKTINQLSYGGINAEQKKAEAYLVSAGRTDGVLAGDEVTFYNNGELAQVIFDINLPLDVKLENLTFDVPPIEGMDIDTKEILGTEFTANLIIETENEIPFDLIMGIEVVDSNGNVSNIPLGNNGKLVSGGQVGQPVTSRVESSLTSENLNLLLMNKEMQFKFTLASPDQAFSQFTDKATVKVNAVLELAPKSTSTN